MTIYPELDFESGQYVLMVSGGGCGRMPAGPRLFQVGGQDGIATPAQLAAIPSIKFSHESLDGAEGDARKLRAYLDRQ